ncbi:MAG: hypothetical protein ACK4RN_18635 [Pseudorhodobacter sp.]
MARPKHDNPELFTVGEVAHAAELSPRNIQLLGDKDLTPQAEHEANGKAGAALHNINAFMHFAMVGALHKAGLPLLQAARLALAVPDEFTDARLGYLSGLDRQRLDGMRGWHKVAPEDGDTGFWLHYWLRRNAAPAYVPGRSWDNDIVMLVADRRYALIDLHERRGANMTFGGLKVKAGPEPVCEIEDADRGLRTVPVYQRPECKTEEGKRALLNEYRGALTNAVGLSRSNLSLAIRKGLDRVYDLRMQKGGRLLPN